MKPSEYYEILHNDNLSYEEKFKLLTDKGFCVQDDIEIEGVENRAALRAKCYSDVSNPCKYREHKLNHTLFGDDNWCDYRNRGDCNSQAAMDEKVKEYYERLKKRE
jgi:hypothetical protein